MNLEGHPDFELRDARHEHYPYILSTWVRSALGRLDKLNLPRSLLASGIHDIATSNLGRVQVLVSAGSDGSTVHGWICGRQGAVHWVYVPHDIKFRCPDLQRVMVRAVCGPAKEEAA